MKSYIVYDDKGAILQTGRCPESMLELQGSPGRNMLAGIADQLTEYVIAGAIVQRPAMAVLVSKETAKADGTDEIIITGLPPGADLFISGPAVMEGKSDGAPAVLTFSLTGTYTVSITLFPYQDMKVTLHAT